MTSADKIVAGERWITPACRQNRTMMGAWLQATHELQNIYERYARHEGNAGVTWRLTLTREDATQQKTEVEG